MQGAPDSTGIPEDKFLQVKLDAETKYKVLTPVRCPYFKDDKDGVHFNAKGLDHVKFKEWNKPRGRFDQYIRLKLLYLAPEVIKRSHTVQGIWEVKEWERRKSHGKWAKVPLDVVYYEFVAVIGHARIKVIVKMLPGGSKYFWTLIPFWKQNPISGKRVMHDSDTETEAWNEE